MLQKFPSKKNYDKNSKMKNTNIQKFTYKKMLQKKC